MHRVNEKITTILFDFDGTLMNTNDLIMDSWRHIYRVLEDKDIIEEEIVRTFGEPLIKTMEKAFPNIPVDECVEIYRSYHRESFGDRISLFPGIKEMLGSLKALGYKMAVVTSRAALTTKQAMERYEIMEYFDVVITCDDTDKHKPHPEPVFIALDQLNSRPEESIMIGDSMYDILCAKNAGVQSVLVGWAVAVLEEEKTGIDKPDYFVETANDIVKLVEEKNSSLDNYR